MTKYEYEIENRNGNEYEVSYYYFNIKEDMFLCKLYKDIEDASDTDLKIATTRDSYELEELILDEETMINKTEFERLYKKLNTKFEINMF